MLPIVCSLLGSLAAVAASQGLAKRASPTSGLHAKRPNEYCASETMSADCGGDDQVVLMERALYGRMEPGYCVSTSYASSIGCYADVLAFLDAKCSGLKSCRLLVATLEEHAQPCDKDFKSYLQASFSCVRVSSARGDLCMSGAVIPLSETHGYVTPGAATTVPSRQLTCRWHLQAGSGQGFAITLISFRAKFVGSRGSCFAEVVLRDNVNTKLIDPCSAQQRRQLFFKTSESQLDVEISIHPDVDNVPMFLLKYDVEGCADLELSGGMHSRRDGDNIVLHCNQTNETWFLTCRNGDWIGNHGNCTAGTDYAVYEKNKGAGQSFHRAWIVFAIIIGVILGLLVGTSLLTIVLMWKRSRSKKQQKAGRAQGVHELTANSGGALGGECTAASGHDSFPALLRQEKLAGSNVSEYTHVFEVQAPLSGDAMGGCRVHGPVGAVGGSSHYDTKDCAGLAYEDHPARLQKDVPLYFDMDMGVVHCHRHAAT